MEDVPEPAAPPAPTRRDWFGIIVSLAALATSGASIFIAVQNADSMERLVEANSWPYLQLDSSNVVDGVKVVQLSLSNTGVGPMRLETFIIYGQDGEPLPNMGELIRHAYDASWELPTTAQERQAQGWGGDSPTMFTATPGGRVIAPGEGTLVFAIPFEGTPPDLWQAVDQARFSYRFEACYCSVFDECWRSDMLSTRPTPVPRCPPQADSWRG